MSTCIKGRRRNENTHGVRNGLVGRGGEWEVLVLDEAFHPQFPPSLQETLPPIWTSSPHYAEIQVSLAVQIPSLGTFWAPLQMERTCKASARLLRTLKDRISPASESSQGWCVSYKSSRITVKNEDNKKFSLPSHSSQITCGYIRVWYRSKLAQAHPIY